MFSHHHRKNEDGSHEIEISALRVLLFPEGSHWIAQGLDVDYAAAGATLDDAKDRFAKGLCLTLQAHLERSGSLDAFMRPAPPDLWKPYYALVQEGQALLTDTAEPDSGPLAGFRRLAFLRPTQRYQEAHA